MPKPHKQSTSADEVKFPLKKVLVLLSIWKVALLCFAWLGTKVLTLQTMFLPVPDLRSGVPFGQWVWANMDGDHYTRIARWGYAGGQHIFFPLLPIAIQFTHTITGLPYISSGLLATHVLFLTALWFVYKLLKVEGQRALFPVLLLIILCFPTSGFYTAIYTDSIFFLMATMTIYFGRTRQFWLAGLTGFLAGMTRLNGLALIGYIGIEYLFGEVDVFTVGFKHVIAAIKRQLHPKTLMTSGALLAIGPAFGLFMYLWYTQQQYGDWYLVFSDASIWGRQHMVFPLQTFWRYIKILFLSDHTTFVYWVAIYELLSTVFYFAILGWSWKKIRISYWCYTLFYLLIPLSTGTLQGMNRYGLHLFPFFFGLALLFKRYPRWLWVYCGIGILLLALTVMAYTRGYFIA